MSNLHGYEAGFTIEQHRDELIERLGNAIKQLNDWQARAEAAEAALDKEERAHLQTVDERDAAEEALSQAFYLVTGRSPEWSNLFGHAEALEEIEDAQTLLRKGLKAAEQSAIQWKELSEGQTRVMQCEEKEYEHALLLKEHELSRLRGKLEAAEAKVADIEAHHKWTGQRRGGDPAGEGYAEYVRYCDLCGMEDDCEDVVPPCSMAPSRVEQLEVIVADLLAMLKRLEWDWLACCPVCMVRSNTHAQDCELAVLLKEEMP